MVTPAAYFWPFPLTSLIGCWHNYILIHITYILLYPCPEWVTGQDPYPKKKELVTTVPLWTSCYLKVKCTWLRIPRSHFNMSCGPVCCWANIATRHVNVFTFWQSSIYIYICIILEYFWFGQTPCFCMFLCNLRHRSAQYSCVKADIIWLFYWRFSLRSPTNLPFSFGYGFLASIMALFLRSLALSFAAAADIPTVKLNNGVEMPVLAFAAEAGECHSSGNIKWYWCG